MLNIKNRRQVAVLEMHFLQKEIGLLASRRVIAPEMVCSADETIFACLIKIIFEVGIDF